MVGYLFIKGGIIQCILVLVLLVPLVEYFRSYVASNYLVRTSRLGREEVVSLEKGEERSLLEEDQRGSTGENSHPEPPENTSPTAPTAPSYFDEAIFRQPELSHDPFSPLCEEDCGNDDAGPESEIRLNKMLVAATSEEESPQDPRQA